jgi:hypothetical protein
LDDQLVDLADWISEQRRDDHPGIGKSVLMLSVVQRINEAVPEAA